MLKTNEVYLGDSLVILKDIDDCSIDSIVTDPPYGYSFMNKGWDKVLISVELWKECLRVLKPGSFAAIMSSPRQDILSRMIVNLQDAGFRTDFTSIYWTYPSGFPKAANVSKLVDKRNGINRLDQGLAQYLRQKRLEKGYSLKDVDKWLNGKDIASHLESLCNSRNCLPRKHYYLILKEKLDLDNRFDELIEREEAEREIIGQNKTKDFEWHKGSMMSKETTNDYTSKTKSINITKSATDKAKELDGSYAGFQPKPALEVVILVMKPLSEKSYVDQALKNGKGITWLDNVRIPFQDSDLQELKDKNPHTFKASNNVYGDYSMCKEPWEIPKGRFPANLLVSDSVFNEYSRYFDLERWFDTTFPFIITPKASSSERNKGLDKWIDITVNDGRKKDIDNPFQRGQKPRKNSHPTIKPIKLMSWLITLLTKENDIVLDPFLGSGTTAIAAKMLNRRWIGIEKEKDYVDISEARLLNSVHPL